MNKLLSLTLTFSLISLISSSQAASITINGGGIAIKDKTGAAYTGNGAVRIGWFTTYSAAGISSFTTSLAGSERATVATYIQNNFIPIAEAGSDADYGVAGGANGTLGIKANTAPVAGEPATGSMTISGSVSTSTWTTSAANSGDTAGIPRGTRLFLLIYNDADITKATQLGIFSGAGTSWIIPTSTLVTTASVTLSSIDDAAGTGVATEFFRGSKGSLVMGDFSPPAVPEPSTFTLAGLAVLGLIGNRRRQA